MSSLAAMRAFLCTKLSEAEQAVLSREEMATCAERVMTPAEWRSVMALMQPEHRHAKQPTPEECRSQAAMHRRIADKDRHEGAMFRAALVALADLPDAPKEGADE